MRIVGGELKGRRLATPKSNRIRPTTDRTRESLFNILANRFDFSGKRVIDLFAGTGALGIEAISRGAAYCLFVEDGTEGRALIESNIENFALQGRTRIFRRDATRLGECGNRAKFDLAFLDPPYGRGFGRKAMNCLLEGDWLSSQAMIILEESDASVLPGMPGVEEVDQRHFGKTLLSFFVTKT